MYQLSGVSYFHWLRVNYGVTFYIGRRSQLKCLQDRFQECKNGLTVTENNLKK